MRTWNIILSALLFLVGVAAELPAECNTLFGGLCDAGQTIIDLETKGLTDADVDPCLGACLDEAGRNQIVTILLSNNDISTFPAGTFDGLSSLTDLRIHSNDLTDLPEGLFAGLDALEILYLYSNDLTELPEGLFAGLGALTRLDLDGNDLTTVPIGVFEDLVLLETLNLYENAISSLPAGAFDGLSSLTKLNLYDNELTELASGLFAGLGSLTELILEENSLTTLPSGIFEDLVLLEELILQYNELTTLPDGIFATLSSLLDLELYSNSISSLPAGVFAGLSSLQQLQLNSNELTALPAGIFAGLGALTYLDLDRNSLTTLPAGLFVDLVLLDNLDVATNPDLQCLPETADPAPAVDDVTILTTGICECTPTIAVSCEAGTTCSPGDKGYTCEEDECCEDESLTSPTCILEEDLSKAVGETCNNSGGCDCASGNCNNGVCEECPEGITICDDPHMHGLRGQRIDWSGVDGGWYCLVKDDEFDVHVNVRLTAPLPLDFPDRQLITGLSIVSGEHSFVIEVKNPYTIDTEGCPDGTQICLSNGGLRAIVDNEEQNDLLRPTRNEVVAGGFKVSASNLPVECRQFGGDRIWARMYDEMRQGSRELGSGSFEDWVTDFGNMAAPDWCQKYISERGLDAVQSIHSVFSIETRAVSLRLHVGIGYQVGGQLDWDGRVLPDLEFWQMDVGIDGLSLEHESMSGILGETARPVLDEEGIEIMNGYEAFRGNVDDYRVAAAVETDFSQLHQTGS